MRKIQFTKDGYEKLQAELAELTNVKRPAAVERLQKARAMGDLSENSEYTAAKEDLALVEGRIRELEDLLQSAEIIEQNNADNSVEIGCRVMVETKNGKDEFLIVGEFEADPIAKKLSHTSPIGQALLGKKKGDHVEVEVPIGKMSYKILDIKKS